MLEYIQISSPFPQTFDSFPKTLAMRYTSLARFFAPLSKGEGSIPKKFMRGDAVLQTVGTRLHKKYILPTATFIRKWNIFGNSTNSNIPKSHNAVSWIGRTLYSFPQRNSTAKYKFNFPQSAHSKVRTMGKTNNSKKTYKRTRAPCKQKAARDFYNEAQSRNWRSDWG